MDLQSISLIVFYEGPFWVGIFERTDSGTLQAARYVFGAEPKDTQILETLHTCWTGLEFTASLPNIRKNRADSPKRRQRRAAQEMRRIGPSTKSQLALSMAREANKEEQKQRSRQRKDEHAQRVFEKKQEKRREKHRGH